MSSIASNSEDLILNADGGSSTVKFKIDGTEKASISSAGAFTSTTIDATKLTGTIPNFTSTGIDDNATSNAITIDASENVGIGVVPETDWWSSTKAMQLSTRAAWYQDSGGTVVLSNNNKDDGTGAYLVTDEAAKYTLGANGTHTFSVTPSGTADAAITWTTAMTIDNSGRVIQHKKMYSIYKSYGGSTGDLTGGTLEDAEGISFNTTTGKWTAPIAGLYQLGGSFYTDGDTTMEVYVKKNGTGTAYLNNLTANRNSFGYSVSTIMYLAANDTVGFSTLKGTIRSSASDWRWIFRVG